MKKLSEIYFLFGAAILYFITRLINLSHFPIFTDEAIYSYWAQVALNDPVNRYISLEDGKQPLFIWLAAISQKFIHDPLIATRLISAIAGFGSLIGIYLLTKTLLNKKTAILASALYILMPLTILYDRMALFDSLLTMLVIYSTLLIVKLAQNPRFDLALLTGLSLGLGMITKSSANIYLYLLPTAILIFDFKNKDLFKRLVRFTIYIALIFLIAEAIYNSLRLSPLFYMIARKNLTFIRPISEVVKDPFMHFYSNTHAMLSWLITYISLPMFVLFLAGLILAYAKKNRALIYISLLALIPFFAEALFNQVLYPRFILFYFPFIIILISYAVFWIKEKYPNLKPQLTVVFFLFLLVPSITSFKLLTNPKDAKIADSDAGQYLNGWPSGYGVYEVRDLLRSEPMDKDIYVGTEGTFGLLPFALQIYFYGQQNMHIIGFWPVDQNNIPQQVLDYAKTNKTYFVFNENQKEITNSKLKLITKYQKGVGNSYMRLYEVTR